MKNLVIIYFGDDWHKEIPISNELTREAFKGWGKMGAEIGVAVYRASIAWYNLEENVFQKAWAFKNGQWLKLEEKIKPDLIYDKVSSRHDYELFELKKQIAAKTKLFNDPQFRAIVGNKLSQYMLFREFMPKSMIVNNEKEFKKSINKIKSAKIVVKPLYGSGGNGIVIDERDNIFTHEFTFPVLIQEFIISEKGIPGFSKQAEISDLRLVFNHHELTYALSRIAKPGSLFTNLHQGASGVMVPVESIPMTVQKITKKILKRLSVFPEAQYSLDFIFNNQGKPYLVELNTTPGIDLIYTLGTSEIILANFKAIAELIKKNKLKDKCS